MVIDFVLLQCAAARNMLEGAGDLKRKWTWAVEWLHDELERGGGHRWLLSHLEIGFHTFATFFRAPYANTASSNETANGYFLERSHSARLTLEKACELMPEEEVDQTLHMRKEQLYLSKLNLIFQVQLTLFVSG